MFPDQVEISPPFTVENMCKTSEIKFYVSLLALRKFHLVQNAATQATVNTSHLPLPTLALHRIEGPNAGSLSLSSKLSGYIYIATKDSCNQVSQSRSTDCVAKNSNVGAWAWAGAPGLRLFPPSPGFCTQLWPEQEYLHHCF